MKEKGRMPMALVEAMSMGVPVLGSDISGINFVLKDFPFVIFTCGRIELAKRLQEIWVLEVGWKKSLKSFAETTVTIILQWNIIHWKYRTHIQKLGALMAKNTENISLLLVIARSGTSWLKETISKTISVSYVVWARAWFTNKKGHLLCDRYLLSAEGNEAVISFAPTLQE